MLLRARGDILFESEYISNESPSLASAVSQTTVFDDNHIVATAAIYTYCSVSSHYKGTVV